MGAARRAEEIGLGFLLSNKTYLGIFFSGLLLVVFITPLVKRLAWRLEAIDRPSHRKIHQAPTPLMGGLAIYLAMWLPILGLCFWDNDVTARLGDGWMQFAVVALAGAAAMLSGIWDDIRGINAWRKLAVQIPLAVLFTVYVGYFHSLNLPVVGQVYLGYLGLGLTILWIVGITNALNLIDGIDGLAAGVAFFVSLTTAILALLGGNDFLALIMLAMAGACLGFLYYNFAPAKIFLGDTGSLFLGMTLATTSILSSSKSQVAASLLVAVVVLGYPVVDTLLAMLRRALYGKPMFSADRGHIHHRLLAKGLGHRRAAMVIYIFCAALSVLALSIVAQNSLVAVVSLLVVGAMVALGFRTLGFFKLFLPQYVRETRARFLAVHHLGELLRAKLSLAANLPQIYALFEQAAAEFGLHSLQIEVDPAVLEAGQPRRHAWTNPKPPEGDPLTEESALFFNADAGLEVRIRYCAAELDEELIGEYLFQLSNLVDAAAARIRTLTPAVNPGRERAKTHQAPSV
jgi:UDP-GlcNAc:undecaprenyl-phosphate GlcNAc-1-phosphate transferase